MSAAVLLILFVGNVTSDCAYTMGAIDAGGAFVYRNGEDQSTEEERMHVTRLCRRASDLMLRCVDASAVPVRRIFYSLCEVAMLSPIGEYMHDRFMTFIAGSVEGDEYDEELGHAA